MTKVTEGVFLWKVFAHVMVVHLLGLATEFMTQKMAKGIYGKKGPSGYSAIYQDFHRSRYSLWTNCRVLYCM